MNRLLSEIGRSQRLAIVHELKRSNGLPVKAIADRLGMSYMGIKQHCIDLEREGYLDTWRNPKPIGRPEMLYRLTRKSHDLFPHDANALTLRLLEGAKQLYGPAAPGKLLFLFFRDQTAEYARKVRGETVADRAKWLVRIRDREGCMSELAFDGGLRIVERHSPMFDVLQAYPETEAMEREMIAQVLGTTVKRESKVTGELYECIFRLE